MKWDDGTLGSTPTPHAVLSLYCRKSTSRTCESFVELLLTPTTKPVHYVITSFWQGLHCDIVDQVKEFPNQRKWTLPISNYKLFKRNLIKCTKAGRSNTFHEHMMEKRGLNACGNKCRRFLGAIFTTLHRRHTNRAQGLPQGQLTFDWPAVDIL